MKITKINVNGITYDIGSSGSEGGGGGTTNYNDLDNKPQINGVTLTRDKTFDELGLEALSNTELENMLT